MADGGSSVRTKKKKTNGGSSIHTATSDMSAFDRLPPIIMMPTPSLAPTTGPTLTPTPTASPTPTPETAHQIERFERRQSPPLVEQSDRQIQSTPSLHSRTSQTTEDSSRHTLGIGSRSTTRSKILIRPIGDRVYPHKDVAKVIAKAITSNFGEGYPNWKKVSAERRKLWFEEFKNVFTWAEADDAQIRKNFEARGSNKFISITAAARKKKSQPAWMGDATYAKLLVHWQTEEYKQLCGTNTGNRNLDSGASMHTSGAKPHISIWEEMKKENDGVDSSVDDFFMRTHKIQKGPNVGNFVSPQSQQRFENYSKLKEEVLSNAMTETEGTLQDNVTQPANQPSDLAIFVQSVGGKKK